MQHSGVQTGRILIVEDDPRIKEMLCFTLGSKGFECKGVANAEQFFRVVSEEPWNRSDVILMDVMLPGKSGFDICEEMKARGSIPAIPVVMLSAKSEEEDLLRGYEAGVDDYITKPFSPRVLLAKLEKIIEKKRTTDLLHKSYRSDVEREAGLIRLSPAEKKVWIDGTRTELTKTEYTVLEFLMAHPETVLERQSIVNAIHGENFHVTSRSIDFLMVGLRKKLGDARSYVKTVRGIGYRFSVDSKVDSKVGSAVDRAVDPA
jgi:two-component system phosphate regulon response regulator PhoB